MSREEILEIVREETVDILYDLNPEEVTMDQTLVKLGANSIDRAEIVLACAERIGIKLTAVELAEVSDICTLVEAMYKKVNE